MARLLLILFIAQVTSVYGEKVKPICYIIPHPDSPIEITSYEALRLQEEAVVSVKHKLQFSNNSQKNVIAIEFGIWSFDAFDSYLGERKGLYLKDVVMHPTKIVGEKPLTHDPQRSAARRREESRQEDEWYEVHDLSFTFFSGVVYVQRLRWEDGTIWRADKLEALNKLFEIHPELRKHGSSLNEKILVPYLYQLE